MPLCLRALRFDNSFAALPATFYTRQLPYPLLAPRLAAYSPEAASCLELASNPDPALTSLLAGQQLLPDMAPLAMVYAGHQFGSYVPRLGDGRGLLLGEVLTSSGQRWDLHLKGAGKTPYSRFGDGRAVLRSSIREFLGSEALAGLKIPTTRALALVDSDTPVLRESEERGAALLRVAGSHIRFGHFEYFAYSGQREALQQLINYCIARYYPEASAESNPAAGFFRAVVKRTALLIARWQACGFTHGVMNTDNMSIVGETFDYGPFGFLDTYQAGYIPNHSDSSGRYAFNEQPSIGIWNCWCLARALSHQLRTEEIEAGLAEYEPCFIAEYSGLMRRKFGLDDEAEAEPDRSLILDALDLLEKNAVDYTIFMRRLSGFIINDDNAQLGELFTDTRGFDTWQRRYSVRLQYQTRPAAARKKAMDEVNPKYILRNYLAQIAIDSAVHARDYSEIETLRRLLSRPFEEQAEFDAYAALPPAWSRELVLSCSS